jgi:UPF0716 protein FxsA
MVPFLCDSEREGGRTRPTAARQSRSDVRAPSPWMLPFYSTHDSRNSGNCLLRPQTAAEPAQSPRFLQSSMASTESSVAFRSTHCRPLIRWAAVPYNACMLLLYLFLLFTVGPLIELTLLFYIGQATHWSVAIALVIFTGIVGAALARWQGVKAIMRVQRRIARGQVPADELFDGVLILVAGIVLVTPGILTDLMGFCLLVPPIRNVVKAMLRKWAKKNIQIRTAQPSATPFWSAQNAPPHFRDEIIDAEVIETRVVE